VQKHIYKSAFISFYIYILRTFDGQFTR